VRDLDASEAAAQRFHGQQPAQGRAELTAGKWRRDANEATHWASDNPLRLSQSASMRRGRRRLLPGLLLKHLDQLVQVSDDELGAMKAIGSVQANAQQSINNQIGRDTISLHPLGRELQLGIWINHFRLLSPFISIVPPVRINVASGHRVFLRCRLSIVIKACHASAAASSLGSASAWANAVTTECRAPANI
jgi:hypothetical protein